MPACELLDNLDKAAKVAAILIGGAWVYLKTIRGRTFTPRLQPMVTGKLVRSNGIQYLLVDVQVQNIGSSVARIKENGSGLIISALQSFGDVNESVDLDVAKLTAVSVFALDKNEIVAMEPGTTIYSQELIEIPLGLYAAFRLELRVSAVHGGFISKKNRKWRAFSIALDVDDADSEKQKKE